MFRKKSVAYGTIAGIQSIIIAAKRQTLSMPTATGTILCSMISLILTRNNAAVQHADP
jgi:hypothetical protein